MPHTKNDFTVQDAIAGARVLYTKLSGGTVANDALFYGVVDIVGYGGNYIPEGPAPKKLPKKLSTDAAKKKLLTLLEPLAEPDGTESAAAFDWKTIAALVLQILPYLLPLFG